MSNEWMQYILISLVLTHLIYSAYRHIDSRLYVKRNSEKYGNILKFKYQREGSIRVKLYFNAQGKIYGFEVKGQSNFDEYGNDIFAAALSVIAQNAIHTIMHVAQETLEFEMMQGYVRCIVNRLKDEAEDSKARTILESTEYAFYLLQSTYSEDFLVIDRLTR